MGACQTFSLSFPLNLPKAKNICNLDILPRSEPTSPFIPVLVELESDGLVFPAAVVKAPISLPVPNHSCSPYTIFFSSGGFSHQVCMFVGSHRLTLLGLIFLTV